MMHLQLSKRESTLGRINRTIWWPCRGVVHQTAGLHLIKRSLQRRRIVETLPMHFLCHSNLTNGFVYRSFINNPVLGLQCEDRGDACIRCNWMTTPGPYVSSIPTSMPPLLLPAGRWSSFHACERAYQLLGNLNRRPKTRCTYRMHIWNRSTPHLGA